VLELLAVASAPSLALFLFFYLRDKYEREPLWLLFRGFWLGALMVIPALFIETFLLDDVFPSPSDLITLFVQLTLGVALIEEGLKFLVLRLYLYPRSTNLTTALCTRRSSRWASLSPRMWATFSAYGIGAGIGRGLLAVPQHALVAVFMGYHLAQARYSSQAWRRRFVLLTALGIPTLVHGFYDWLLFSEFVPGLLGAIPTVAASWFYALRAVRQQQTASPFGRELARRLLSGQGAGEARNDCPRNSFWCQAFAVLRKATPLAMQSRALSTLWPLA
jgi:RsiW-degrading membrane proteinase PrsW (M82 family)